MPPQPGRFCIPRVVRRAGRRRLLLLAALLALIPLTASAAEMMSGDTVIITSPVSDDLYLFGSDVHVVADIDGDIVAVGARVRIDGDVTGSIYATGAEVSVTGNVGGTVMAMAANVSVRGDVGHSLRVVSSDLTVSDAVISRDLVAAATTVEVDERSRIEGDVRLRSTTVELSAPIGGDVRGSADTWRIGNRVTGRIRIDAGRLRFVEGAVISQPVEYTSDREVLIDGGTTVTADLIRHEPDHPTATERLTVTMLFATFRYLWALALGLFLLWVIPSLVLGAGDTLRLRPIGSLGWGALGMLGIPLLVVVLLLSVIGLPVGLVLLASFILVLYASQIVVGIVIGQVLAPASWRSAEQPRLGRTLALGLAIVVIVRSLPIPGWYTVSSLMTALIALGALLIYLLRRPAELRAAT
jgi:cytoskeletal protein CcmA (bactofilin family)